MRTKEQLLAIEDKKLQDAFDNAPWDVKRKQSYPRIGDQLDALYHAGVFPADMASKIKAVKDKIPKE